MDLTVAPLHHLAVLLLANIMRQWLHIKDPALFLNHLHLSRKARCRLNPSVSQTLTMLVLALLPSCLLHRMA